MTISVFVFQGTVVSILYCFTSEEVHNDWKLKEAHRRIHRAIKRYPSIIISKIVLVFFFRLHRTLATVKFFSENSKIHEFIIQKKIVIVSRQNCIIIAIKRKVVISAKRG